MKNWEYNQPMLSRIWAEFWHGVRKHRRHLEMKRGGDGSQVRVCECGRVLWCRR